MFIISPPGVHPGIRMQPELDEFSDRQDTRHSRERARKA
jgi:hypothetical protein